MGFVWHKDRGQHNAGRGEDDLQVMGVEPRAEPAAQTEQEHKDAMADDLGDLMDIGVFF